ncbi:RNA polymerase sigma-70 factor [Butyricimonas hominis]|mgnify:FL=1|uniref:RNA polymerase sigma-70 factor n=1 Tax=Butyricimonas TaxID=574697 RepID=UPI0035167CBD
MDTREVDIIQEFARGGEKAFRVLYDRYVVALRYFAAKYVTDEDVIEDVVQDAFVALWEKRMEFRVENAVKAYLYKAVRHDCLNLLRHRQVENKYAERMIREGDDSESFLDQILESEIFQALLSVFDELSPACKEVYQMSLDGNSHEEIARKLNISVNTVKKHKNNANHYMKERLKNVLSILLWIS